MSAAGRAGWTVHGADADRVELEVADLGRSVAFYRALLGTNPVEVRPRSAVFALEAGATVRLSRGRRRADAEAEPRCGGPARRLRVDTPLALAELAARLATAHVPRVAELGASCGVVVSEAEALVRVAGPDGERWEVEVARAPLRERPRDDAA